MDCPDVQRAVHLAQDVRVLQIARQQRQREHQNRGQPPRHAAAERSRRAWRPPRRPLPAAGEQHRRAQPAQLRGAPERQRERKQRRQPHHQHQSRRQPQPDAHQPAARAKQRVRQRQPARQKSHQQQHSAHPRLPRPRAARGLFLNYSISRAAM